MILPQKTRKGNGVPMNYSLVIYLNDPSRPRVVYSLLSNSTAHTQGVYAEVSKFAGDVSAAVRALILSPNRTH